MPSSAVIGDASSKQGVRGLQSLGRPSNPCGRASHRYEVGRLDVAKQGGILGKEAHSRPFCACAGLVLTCIGAHATVFADKSPITDLQVAHAQ